MSEEGGAESISNDQKLAQFHEVTHLDDLDQCQAILESTNWDLDQAIQSYFSTQLSTGSEEINANDNEDLIEVVSSPPYRGPPPPPPRPNYDHIPHETLNTYFNNLSTQNLGNPSQRLLVFNLTYLDKVFKLYLQDTETVGTLKEHVEEQIHVPRKHIKLNGWPTPRNGEVLRFISDSSRLCDLRLPQEIDLHVVNMQTVADDIQNAVFNIPGATFASSSSASEPDEFEIVIKIVTSNDDKINRLHFGRQTTFVDIRRRLATLTGLTANDQEWWYYKPNNEMNDDEQIEDLKAINTVERFQEAQRGEKLLGLSLNLIAEDSFTLSRIKSLFDEFLSNPQPSQTKSASASTVKNKLMFVINSRRPGELDEEVNPSTSGLNERHKQGSSLSDYVLVQEHGSQDDLDNEDALMTSAHEDDIDDDILNNEESETSTKKKPMISSDCPAGDETEGTLKFREEFLKRYGPVFPIFYTGKLEDAIRDALGCPARDRRLLGIYLHSDHTVFCNIFASNTVCNETVVNFLTSNFIVWPWDLTVKQHETHFYDICSKSFGSTIAARLKNHRDKLPLFLIVTRVRSTYEIVAIVEGDSTSDQMMQRLMQCSEMFEAQRMNDERDEREREERERIKREQDQAYRESLENDKAKRQRHEAEEETKKRERVKAEEEERRRVEAIETRKNEALARLAPEPNPDETQVARVRFRLPDGEILQRRFGAKEKLSALIDFVTGHGFFPDEYKLLSSWPRRDLTTEGLEKTLEELKIYPQETLTLEQR